jgi:hypothetical protein
MSGLLERAGVVVLVEGDTPGLQWEMSEVRRLVPPGRVFVFTPIKEFRQDGWHVFSALLRAAGFQVPSGDPGPGCVIGFEDAFRAVVLRGAKSAEDYARAIEEHGTKPVSLPAARPGEAAPEVIPASPPAPLWVLLLSIVLGGLFGLAVSCFPRLVAAWDVDDLDLPLNEVIRRGEYREYFGFLAGAVAGRFPLQLLYRAAGLGAVVVAGCAGASWSRRPDRGLRHLLGVPGALLVGAVSGLLVLNSIDLVFEGLWRATGGWGVSTEGSVVGALAGGLVGFLAWRAHRPRLSAPRELQRPGRRPRQLSRAFGGGGKKPAGYVCFYS